MTGRAILFVCCWMLASATADAAVIRLWPKFRSVLNTNQTPVDPAFILSDAPYAPMLAPREANYMVSVDVLMTIDDLQDDQLGIANAAFSAVWTSSFGQANSKQFYPADLPDAGRKFPGACDCELSPPLQNARFSLSPQTFQGPDDPRRTLGMAPYHNGPTSPHTEGEYVGWFLLELNGSSPHGRIELVDVFGETYDADLERSSENVQGLGGSLVFGVPEPASWHLASVVAGAMAVLGLRRRASLTA